MKAFDELLLVWLAASSLFVFLLFGWDKFRAARSGRRVSEFHLVLAGALGGWWGGLLGMLVFRHKTAKLSFQLKYGAGLVIWAGLVGLGVAWR